MRKHRWGDVLPLLIGFLFYSSFAAAQQDVADSIVGMISKVKKVNVFDTAAFNQVRDFIQASTLNDFQIKKIEDAAASLNEGDDMELYFLIRQRIMQSLVVNDVNRAIDYGHKSLAAIDKSNTPEKVLHKDVFLTVMRLPYRNSTRIEEGMRFYNQLILEAKPRNDSIILAQAYYVLGGFYNTIGLIDQAIYNFRKSLLYMDTVSSDTEVYWGFKKRVNGRERWINNMNVVASEYIETRQYDKALVTIENAAKANPDLDGQAVQAIRKAEAMLGLDSLETIPELFRTAYQREFNNSVTQGNHIFKAGVMQTEALYYMRIGHLQKAETILNECKALVNEYRIPPAAFAGTIAPDYYFALLRKQQKRYADAVDHLEKDIERMANLRKQRVIDYRLLGDIYEEMGKGNEAALAYQQYNLLQDAILEEQAKFRRSSFEIEQEMNERELSITNLQSENKIAAITRNFVIALSAILLLLALFAYSRYRIKQRDNQLLGKTLSTLKQTQSQLIQSEKMASLGELTAGIAHEIQNPLNFVNNFSEINDELITELVDELKSGNTDEAIAIAADIKSNAQKINEHGKRAGSIVKGMLEHSRKSDGQKEPTDINQLADECLRLAYHGMRAKDKEFNCEYRTEFDERLPKINVVSQDISRVLLNLINNAFYAVNEKAKTAEEGYQPQVFVSTAEENGKVIIAVQDNGNGIPDTIKDKIFQPFFTTKPTGSGTGLGLSLSYDIVKAHGGEINVARENNKYTCFTITLPA